MVQQLMFSSQDGSPFTTITENLGADAETDTHVHVAELGYFPEVTEQTPNLCTISVGVAQWERCKYTAKSNSSGAGTLTIVRSGSEHASSSGGAPVAFSSGARVARNYTSLDHARVKANIEDLALNKVDKGNAVNVISELTPAANKLPYYTGVDTGALTDLSSLGRSLIGQTTEAAIQTLIKTPSVTTGNMTIYVNSAASGGLQDGSSAENGFLTLAAALAACPAVINHEVTITICEGSGAYSTPVTIQKVVGSGKITIQGEYYGCGFAFAGYSGELGYVKLPSNTAANKFGSLKAGDTIWAIKYSVAGSESSGGAAPLDCLRPTTVESVAADGSYYKVKLTDNIKDFSTDDPTKWAIYWARTKITALSAGGVALTINMTNNVYVLGLCFEAASACINPKGSLNGYITNCSCRLTASNGYAVLFQYGSNGQNNASPHRTVMWTETDGISGDTGIASSNNSFCSAQFCYVYMSYAANDNTQTGSIGVLCNLNAYARFEYGIIKKAVTGMKAVNLAGIRFVSATNSPGTSTPALTTDISSVTSDT